MSKFEESGTIIFSLIVSKHYFSRVYGHKFGTHEKSKKMAKSELTKVNYSLLLLKSITNQCYNSNFIQSNLTTTCYIIIIDVKFKGGSNYKQLDFHFFINNNNNRQCVRHGSRQWLGFEDIMSQKSITSQRKLGRPYFLWHM